MIIKKMFKIKFIILFLIYFYFSNIYSQDQNFRFWLKILKKKQLNLEFQKKVVEDDNV